MSDNETVLELVKGLPPNVSVREIVSEIEFIAAEKEGLEEINQGKFVSIESVKQMIEAWASKQFFSSNKHSEFTDNN